MTIAGVRMWQYWTCGHLNIFVQPLDQTYHEEQTQHRLPWINRLCDVTLSWVPKKKDNHNVITFQTLFLYCKK